jgi:hypothetical protein
MDLFEACQSEDLAAVKEALNNGADVNATNNEGTTPLIVACNNKHKSEIVQLLIEAGANLDAVDKDGDSPLLLA